MSGDYIDFVTSKRIENKIGVTTVFDQCNGSVKGQFSDYGEVGILLVIVLPMTNGRT
jgi:hypothetical protein